MVNLAIEQYLGDMHSQQAAPEEILEWAWKTFAPAVAASSSFQTQSVPLLHMISRVCPELPVIFVDTGFHFPETLAFRDMLQERLGLNIIVARPERTPEELAQEYGQELFRRDPDLCCYLNKVQPLQQALDGMCAWVTGIRHDQTASRGQMRSLEPQLSGVVKIHPLLRWTREMVEEYRRGISVWVARLARNLFSKRMTSARAAGPGRGNESVVCISIWGRSRMSRANSKWQMANGKWQMANV